MKRFKQSILDEYQGNDPHLSIQYAAFDHQGGGDDLMTADKEGHCVKAELTYTLLSDEPDVRVLLNPYISRETALKLIDKIRDSIRDCGGWRYVVDQEEDIWCNELQEECQKQEFYDLIFKQEYTMKNLDYLMDIMKIISDKNQQDIQREKNKLDKPQEKDVLSTQF